MINVVDSYKLVKVFIEGKEYIVKAEDTSSWNVIKVKTDEGIIVANEGDSINFVTESGEVKKGNIVKLSGKKEKTKVKFVTDDGTDHDETWGVTSIKEDTFKVEGFEPIPVEDDESDENEEDEE